MRRSDRSPTMKTKRSHAGLYDDSPRDRSPDRRLRKLEKSPDHRRRVRDLSMERTMTSSGRADLYDDYARKSDRSGTGYSGYRILCLSNLSYKVSDSVLRETLQDQFTRFGDVTVKLHHDGNERVAYLYFRSYEEAKEARHAKSRMMLFDKPVQIEPILERSAPRPRNRSTSPEYIPSHRGISPAMSGANTGLVRRPRRNSMERMPQHMGVYRDGPAHHMNNDGGHRGGGFERGGGGGGGGGRRRENNREKFPNYLHHIPPEEDDKATRTLFIGNLEVTIAEAELRRIFERYGVLEDIDIKRPPPGQGNAYAFIKFLNLDMAHRAKVEMSGQYIGKFQCKIGYGKATPTTRIWVGGLGPWTSLAHLEREFDRFGAIRKIDFIKGENHAYIQYDSIDAAQAAAQEMRGFPLGGPDKKLRVDFADPGPYSYYEGEGGSSERRRTAEGGSFDGGDGRSRRADEFEERRKRPHTPDSDQNAKTARRSRTPEPDGSARDFGGTSPKEKTNGDRERVSIVDSVATIAELANCCPSVWTGSMILKTSAFPTKMLLCSGDPALVDMLLKDTVLRVTQRLRLDPPKLEDVQKRLNNAGSDGCCILLTVSGPSSQQPPLDGVLNRQLKNLVTYLKQKEAAGVVPLPYKKDGKDQVPAVLYAFPPCQFAMDVLKKIAPNLTDSTKEDHLVVIIVKAT